ncbi:MAG: DUF3833 domain-containing protein [Pseudorhodobacter sp.]
MSFPDLFLGMLTMLALLAILRRVTGFRSQKPSDLAAKSPPFDLRRHLSGPILCEGVVYGPTGRVASRFVADMEGHWTGNQGILAERFRYDSGLEQNRQWSLKLGNDGSIIAEAADIVGQGEGRVEGAGVVMRYRIRLDPAAGGHVLDVTDWMYVMENGTIMNRSQFYKWGVKVAELIATMRPKEKRNAA